MSNDDRASLAAFSRADPAVAAFLAAMPPSLAWVVDADATPVTLDRVAPGHDRGCCLTTPPLDAVNAAIRGAAGEWETVVAVSCDGDRRAVELRAFPVPGLSGDIICTARDVTKEERLKAKLDASAAAMRELRLAATIGDVEAARLALSDALTGLPNRRAFDIELAQACRDGTFALALFDMDRFKSVNDTLGHPVGDRMLRAVAEELARHTRSADFVARLGGDEFAVILADIETLEAARDTAERLMRSFSARVDLGDVDLSVGLSAGVAVHCAGDDPASVYREADMALHTAKVRRRGSLVLSEARAVQPSAREELKTVKALLSGRPIGLAEAPVADASGRIVGHQLSLAGAAGQAFDSLFATAARFGLGRDLLAAVLRRFAEAAAAHRGGGRVHVRLPAEAVQVDGVVSLLIQSLARAGALPSDLFVELPLAAFARDGAGDSVAAALTDAGVALVLGDWDMSFAAFRTAVEGRFGLVAFDAASVAPSLAGPMAEVWRAAFRSLAASGIAACARGVADAAAARELVACGVALTTGTAREPLPTGHPSPHYA